MCFIFFYKCRGQSARPSTAPSWTSFGDGNEVNPPPAEPLPQPTHRRVKVSCRTRFHFLPFLATATCLAVVALVAWWFYKSGKRIGSRKGYGVGRSRSRRRR